MTKTLTTETIKLWRSNAEITLGETDELDPENNAAKAILALTAELLANREAQPVALVDRRPAAQGGVCWQSGGRDLPHGTGLFTAPPAPAVPTPVNFSENADADTCRKWAWKQVKELVSADGWTLGDNITYFGFFCWGWDMRRQYNEQRPPVVTSQLTGAPDLDDITLETARAIMYDVDRRGDFPGGACQLQATLQYHIENACRAAMLAQPQIEPQNIPNNIPDGLVAAINRLLDSDGSRGCFSAVRSYDAREEIERLLAAAPEGGNG